MNRRPFTGSSRTIVENNSNSTNNFLQRFVRNRSNNNNAIILEEIVDVESDITNFNNNTLQLPNPRILYQTGMLLRNTGLFTHSSERSLSVLEGNQTIINLVSNEAGIKLRNKKYKYFHPGIIIVGIKGMFRKHLGAKLLIVIYDDRWTTNIEAGILAITEVDLNENKGLFYFSPGYFMEIKDFCKHIKIGLKVRGFEGFNNSNNLVICIGIMGKCMNNTTINFKINTEGVIRQITSSGIQLIEPPKINPNDNAGLEWNLSTLFNNSQQLLNPTKGIIYKKPDNSVSLRFGSYQNITAPNLEESSDDEISNNDNI